MRYIKITTSDVANGLGVRVTLWVAGCRRNCPGCHNPETHSFAAGRQFTAYVQDKLFTELSKDYIAGLTLSGGDPMDSLEDIKKLCKDFREVFGRTKNIWLYTGLTLEEFTKLWPEAVEYIDIVVEGPFVQNLRNTSLAFRGSSNQNIWKSTDGSWVKITEELDATCEDSKLRAYQIKGL